MTGVSNVRALFAPKATGDRDFCHTQKLQSEVASGWRRRRAPRCYEL